MDGPAAANIIIDCVDLPGAGATPGLISQLDLPRPNATYETYCLAVEGYAFSTGGAPPVKCIRVSEGGVHLRVVPLSVPRPEVASEHTEAPRDCGFWVPIGTLALPERFRLDLHVSAPGHAHDGAWVARVHGRRAVPRVGGRDQLQPLLVSSLGRSGSTLLMRLLAAHPSIVTYDAYPYEVRPARYWFHALRVMTEPANHADSGSPGGFTMDVHHVGHNPFNTAPLTDNPVLGKWLGQTHVARSATATVETVEQFYRLLAEQQGRAHGTRYFAEKYFPDGLADIACDMYVGSRELVLIRDFRDVICSIHSFNSKRGSQDFGRGDVTSDRDYVRKVRFDAELLLRRWERRASHARLVHYEDLVRAPERTLAGVFAYLGLDAPRQAARDAAAANADCDEMAAHRTARSALESIGRWRTELTPELRALCEAELTGVLVAFGYQ